MENARCSKSLRNNRIPYSTDVRPSNQVTKIRTKRFIPNEVFPRDLWIGLIKVTTASVVMNEGDDFRDPAWKLRQLSRELGISSGSG